MRRAARGRPGGEPVGRPAGTAVLPGREPGRPSRSAGPAAADRAQLGGDLGRRPAPDRA